MDQSLDVFEVEVEAAKQAAAKYFSNYHAWNYRLFILETWMKSNNVPEELKQSILKKEKNTSDVWLKNHVSDYCGFHYRQRLLFYLVSKCSEAGETTPVLLKELEDNQEMIFFYPGHESLWYHRRIIVKQYIEALSLDKIEDLKQLHGGEHDLVRQTTLPEAPNGDKCDASNKVMGFVATDCSQLNHLYSQRYLKWLKICFRSVNM